MRARRHRDLAARKICAIAIDEAAVGRWSLNACGYTITARILWMEGHRGTASMSRGHQTGQARIASTVGPRWFTTRRATRVQPSGVKSRAVHIYVRHLRRSLSSVRQRNYISKWTLMNLLRYRRVCEDSAMNMYGSITFNHALEKKSYVKTNHLRVISEVT